MPPIRETSSNKSSARRSTPQRKTRTSQLADTPTKQKQEVIFETPRRKKASAGGKGTTEESSPSRIRVTVEVEQGGEENSAGVKTVKIPLNDVDSRGKTGAVKGTPKKRGRPRKSDAERVEEAEDGDADRVVKRLRRSLPARRRSRRESGLVSDVLPDLVEQEEGNHTAYSQSQEQPKKRRPGRPRKSDVLSSTSQAKPSSSSATKSGSNKKTTASRDISEPLRSSPAEQRVGRSTSTRVQDHADTFVSTSSAHPSQKVPSAGIDTESEQEDAQDDAASYSSAGAEDDLVEDVGETTAELDKSLVESEGFSIVSLDSLRNQKAQTDRQTQLGKQVEYPTLPTLTEDLSPVNEQSQDTERSDISNHPARESLEHDRRQSIFDAFGDSTMRELRNDFVAGERLATTATHVQDTAQASNTSPQDVPLPRLFPRPTINATGEFARLPTPADSVDHAAKPAGVQNSSDPPRPPSGDQMSWRPTASMNSALDTIEDETGGYDEMSWLPEHPRSTARHSQLEGATQHEAQPASTVDDSDIWREEAGRSLDDSLQGRRGRQRQRRRNVEQEINDARPTESQNVAVLVPMPIKRLAPTPRTNTQETQAERPKFQPFNNAVEESPIPSLSALLPVDDKPDRGKIPRTWRRISGSTLLYSDEVEESPQTQQKHIQAAFRSPREVMSNAVPSLFRRISGAFQKPTEAAAVDEQQPESVFETSEMQEVGTEDIISQPEENVRQLNVFGRKPKLQQPRKSILSSPARRSLSPGKSVQWHNDDSLVETRENDTVYSPPQASSSSYDEAEDSVMVNAAARQSVEDEEEDEEADDIDDSNNVDEEMDDNDVSDDDLVVSRSTAQAPQSDYIDFGSPRMSGGRDGGGDRSTFVSSPLNAKAGNSVRFSDQPPATPSTVTDLPTDTATSDDEDITPYAESMTRVSAQQVANLPDTAVDTNLRKPESQTWLSKFNNFFFTFTYPIPIRIKSSSSSSRQVPYTWTREHQILLRELFAYVQTLHPEHPIKYREGRDPLIVRVKPLPPHAKNLPKAFAAPLGQIPKRFTSFIGKSFTGPLVCRKDALCGPHCPGIAPEVKGKWFKHTITEMDVRLAYAFAKILEHTGVFVYDGPLWAKRQDKKVVRDARGHIVMKKENWGSRVAVEHLIGRRVFSCWCNKWAREIIVKKRAEKMWAREDEVGRLWREREWYGL